MVSKVRRRCDVVTLLVTSRRHVRFQRSRGGGGVRLFGNRGRIRLLLLLLLVFPHFHRSDRIVGRLSVFLPSFSRFNDTGQTVLGIIRSRTFIARDAQRVDVRNVPRPRCVFGRGAVGRRFLVRLLLLREFYRPLRPRRRWTPDRVAAHRTARQAVVHVVVNVTVNRACAVTNRISNAVVMHLAAIVKPIGQDQRRSLRVNG